MNDALATPAAGLSQTERFVDTFVAPSKTFQDILRSSSWWVLLIFMLLVGIAFSTAIDKKVGFAAVAQQQMSKNKMASDRIDALPPDQRASQYQAAATRTKYSTYGFGVFIILFALIVSLLWWIGLNFILGASTKFSQVLAVWMYAALPKTLMTLLAAGLLFAGVGLDNFDIQNPVGTNIGYYLPDTMPALKAAMGFIDIFALWSLALGALGTAIIARKKPSQTLMVVGGWWLLGMILVTAMAAIFS